MLRTLVELWNANRFGRYTHIDDPATEPLDPYFFGYGRTFTNEDAPTSAAGGCRTCIFRFLGAPHDS